MTIAFIILYAIGSLSALACAIFIAALGGRPPRFGEWLFLISLVLFWPITLPVMIFKFFT